MQNSSSRKFTGTVQLNLQTLNILLNMLASKIVFNGFLQKLPTVTKGLWFFVIRGSIFPLWTSESPHNHFARSISGSLDIRAFWNYFEITNCSLLVETRTFCGLFYRFSWKTGDLGKSFHKKMVAKRCKKRKIKQKGTLGGQKNNKDFTKLSLVALMECTRVFRLFPPAPYLLSDSALPIAMYTKLIQTFLKFCKKKRGIHIRIVFGQKPRRK